MNDAALKTLTQEIVQEIVVDEVFECLIDQTVHAVSPPLCLMWTIDVAVRTGQSAEC